MAAVRVQVAERGIGCGKWRRIGRRHRERQRRDIAELERINDLLATAVTGGDAEAIASLEFSFHRVFNQASGRIKLAWFLLNVARYMPAQLYAADPLWGESTVDNHRRLIAALRDRDAVTVIEHTVWQFTDAARRLTDTLDRTGIFGS